MPLRKSILWTAMSDLELNCGEIPGVECHSRPTRPDVIRPTPDSPGIAGLSSRLLRASNGSQGTEEFR